ncbi:family 43 glycosylhydrolase [Streptomyces sp. ActVer]|uniref:family 43 glycosylhydrolase n=1 Tax=Streptomyces sp. ActVer TaxID=3014558 RepID=UPI0022B50302|nr:family 43 glycosylhydrolase [Streptomyces sp. ActVer]MCZ4507454.1 family 43 glycosylhydrolase [Streptomyces sp. ActVer]
MRRTIARVVTALLVTLAALASGIAEAAAPASPAVTFTNPIAEQRADPHIFKHTDGYYYFTATVPAYDRIVMRRATTLQGLSTAAETTIWTKHASGEMGAHIWAPEIHFIDGKWYVYFAAGASNDIWKIRPYVLETSAANPLTGTWTEKGRIALPLDTFSLDATTFTVGGTRYLSWAQNDPAVGTGTSIYLAPMSNPWTISGTPARISTPTLSWETVGQRVNEGPAVIQRNGKVFMTFSASATDANYCLGLLTANSTADLMNPASWTKTQTPVFKSNDATGQYGPGHNTFTTSEDGKSDILVYHDRNYKDISGDPLNDPNRRTRYQKLYWNADGTPNLGIPVADGVTPVRFSSYNFPDRFIRHWEYRAKIEPNVTNLADSQFRVVTGLAGTGTVSLESANFPGYYLRHRSNGEVWVDKSDGSTAFKGDASFYRRAGLADASAGVSFESYNVAGSYVRHYNYLLVTQPADTTTAKADATFYAE